MDKTATRADMEAAARALGYANYEDATDYRNSGAQDRAVTEMVRMFKEHRLSAEAAIVAWQPIETAPKDGTIWVATEYSGHGSGFMEPVRWFRGKWQNIYEHGFIEFEPTCWMPLPTPPADTLEQG